MIGSSRVKLNIILNQAQLLVISIYLIDLCRRIVCVAFHLDILHRLRRHSKYHKNGTCVILAGAL